MESEGRLISRRSSLAFWLGAFLRRLRPFAIASHTLGFGDLVRDVLLDGCAISPGATAFTEPIARSSSFRPTGIAKYGRDLVERQRVGH